MEEDSTSGAAMRMPVLALVTGLTLNPGIVTDLQNKH